MCLKTIKLDSVNFSDKSVRQLVGYCKQMKELQEFSLINMHARMREDTLVNIGSSFINHESLEKLDLSNNNLANFDSIIKLLHGNKKIKAINIRGSSMDVN